LTTGLRFVLDLCDGGGPEADDAAGWTREAFDVEACCSSAGTNFALSRLDSFLISRARREGRASRARDKKDWVGTPFLRLDCHTVPRPVPHLRVSPNP
jgi:hypothetical protein